MNIKDINNMLEDKLQTYYKNSLKIMCKKICGYETLYLFSDYDTCIILINKIDKEYPSYKVNKNNKYWVINRDNKRIDIPRKSIKLKDFFRENNVGAIYPLPITTVYQIWFNDNHQHEHCV